MWSGTGVCRRECVEPVCVEIRRERMCVHRCFGRIESCLCARDLMRAG